MNAFQTTTPFYLIARSNRRLATNALTGGLCIFAAAAARADSINSPNITMNVDANRSTGAGAGDVAVAVNTITIAETNVNEYSFGAITLSVRPGFHFESEAPVSIVSATLGFNGAGTNTPVIFLPQGTADETLTFLITQVTGNGQDIIRINGIKLKILNAAGAAGPAQTTMQISTTDAGGAFTNQGIVAASITKGAPDRLVFSVQPGTSQAGDDLLPAVSIVDFGGNIINNDARQIALSIQDNPGAATLNGVTAFNTINGIAAWEDSDNLNITTAANGYTLAATHDGAGFLTSDTVTSGAFDILAGPANHLAVTVQPVDTNAGSPILISVSVLDAGDNLVTNDPVDVTLDSAINPGGWPLLVDTSLTKTTDDGVAEWLAEDNLRINKSLTDYRLVASGLGAPVETQEFDITPADPDHLTITNQPVNTTAGDDILITVEVRDPFENKNTETPVDVTLDLSTNPGAATLEVGTDLTKTSENGVATWDATDDLRIEVAANGYRSLASGVGAADESDAFDILPGAPDRLVFTQQPVDSLVGDDLLIALETRDAFDNMVAADGTAVTLALGENPGNATLEVASTLTKETEAGIVSWNVDDDLRINAAGTGYTLVATADGLEGESDAFNIIDDNAAPDVCGIDCGAGATMTLLPLLLLKWNRRRIRRRG